MDVLFGSCIYLQKQKHPLKSARAIVRGVRKDVRTAFSALYSNVIYTQNIRALRAYSFALYDDNGRL
jgi:hypothetical protein